MRRKVRRRRLRPAIRYFLFLAFVFGVAFFFSGGFSIFESSPSSTGIKPASMAGQTKQTKQTKETAKPAETAETDNSLSGRVFRILFLRRAVAERMESRRQVSLEDMSPKLPAAIVAVEDNRFYDHYGFDLTGIIRATVVNLEYGSIEEGASTITQQLVKNLFLTPERSFSRKFEELILALDMEMTFSKEEILALYLNTIYFGSNYYGIEEASYGYFAKAPRELDLAEASMLAGLPNAPSLYSPYVDFMMAKKRQFIVLDAMVKNEIIDRDTADNARMEPLYLAH